MTVRIPGRGLALLFMILPAVYLPLGLAELTVDTQLNQPVSAEKKMVSVRSKGIEYRRTEPASPDDFDHAVVNRAKALNQLEFTSTAKNCRAERERRVDSAPVGSARPAPCVALMNMQANQQSSVDSKAASTGTKPSQTDSRTYKTQRGDTLSGIVRDRMLDDGFTMQQKMIATWRANPEAFDGNNINNLKTRKVLRLPDRGEIKVISREEAQTEVTRQYANWREFRAKLSNGPPPQPAEVAAETQPKSERQPKLGSAAADNPDISASNNADFQQGSAAGSKDIDAAELQQEFALMRELVESRQQENEELSSRYRELKESVAQQERLIKRQRDEIANLKQHSAEQVAVDSPDLIGETLLPPEPTKSDKPTGSTERQLPEIAAEEQSRGGTVSAVIDFFAIAFISSGLVFFIAGSIGLLRLPDVYSRLHALTKADNVGLGLLVTGILLLASNWLIAVKLVLVWVLVLASSAASAHLIAQRARRREQYAWKP